MDTKVENLSINDKRKFLRELSKAVAPLIKQEIYDTINSAVIDTFYKDKVHTEFKTFPEWKRDGYNVIKGSKAFVVWGRPKSIQKDEQPTTKPNEEQTDEENDFYPLAFLFSNAQVERREAK